MFASTSDSALWDSSPWSSYVHTCNADLVAWFSRTASQLGRLTAGFPPRRTGLDPRTIHVKIVVDKRGGGGIEGRVSSSASASPANSHSTTDPHLFRQDSAYLSLSLRCINGYSKSSYDTLKCPYNILWINILAYSYIPIARRRHRDRRLYRGRC
jgi:hypothetical protein